MRLTQASVNLHPSVIYTYLFCDWVVIREVRVERGFRVFSCGGMAILVPPVKVVVSVGCRGSVGSFIVGVYGLCGDCRNCVGKLSEVCRVGFCDLGGFCG